MDPQSFNIGIGIHRDTVTILIISQSWVWRAHPNQSGPPISRTVPNQPIARGTLATR